MSNEFIGHTSSREGSDIVPASGPVIDRDYIRNHVQAAENAGIDRLLIGQFGNWPDNQQIAHYVFANTSKIGALLAHKPGISSPTHAARQLATLDNFSDGRLWVHVITGGSDADQARDGDFLTHDERYERTEEYLDIVRKTWESYEPFDHKGRFYRIEGGHSLARPFNGKRVPISFGGSSDAAIRVAARHADYYALWGEPLDGVRETIGKVRAAAASHNRADHIRYTLAFRIVAAEAEDLAWEKAAGILEKVKAGAGRAGGNGEKLPSNTGSVRLREAASRGKVLDKRLWTEVAAASGAGGNSTALVGTPEQIADAILDYYDLGVSNFLMRGFWPTDDTVIFGRDIAPLVKAGIAARKAPVQTAAAE